MITSKLIKFIVIGVCFFAFIASANSQDNYLLNPTGKYGVGYQDVFLVNTAVCPDAFYIKNNNEKDFSATNKKHCQEIILRVYYPSRNGPELGDVYYAPYVNEATRWLKESHKFSKQDEGKLDSLANVRTFTSYKIAAVTNHKFPVIIFMPGAGAPAHAYNNIISNLVSNGYIVIGVNSIFINGALQLSNGHVVKPPSTYLDSDGRRENIDALKYVLDNLPEIQSKLLAANIMDLKDIGLIGHSRGAMSIVNLLKTNQEYSYIKSMILMDPGDLLMQANYPLPKFKIPSMVMWSSVFKKDMHGSAIVGKNNFEVVIKPEHASDNFSAHNSFFDNSTLQYHPACQIPAVQKTIYVGDGNGYEIAKEINEKILTFFNRYLKNVT